MLVDGGKAILTKLEFELGSPVIPDDLSEADKVHLILYLTLT